MKIYIFADIEGISGVYTREQVLPNETRFSEGRSYMTADVNACAAGCKAAGADEVVVRDGHGGSYSLIWDRLTDDVDRVICGCYRDGRFAEFDDADGIILLGYHAMAGTDHATLEHTFSSVGVQNYWVNGELAGEVAVDAYIAGDHGVPVIMVSGDDQVCAEAKSLLPWIETAEVKRGLSSFAASLLPPQRAHVLIFDTAKAAVENIQKMKIAEYSKPVTLRTEYTERHNLPNPFANPWAKKIDGRTFEVTADTMEEALFRC